MENPFCRSLGDLRNGFSQRLSGSRLILSFNGAQYALDVGSDSGLDRRISFLALFRLPASFFCGFMCSQKKFLLLLSLSSNDEPIFLYEFKDSVKGQLEDPEKKVRETKSIP